MKADAAVYGLQIVGENAPGAPLYIAKKKSKLVNVAKISTRTGGEIVDVSEEGSVLAAFGTVIRRLQSRYTLGYTPQQHSLQDGRYHKVDATLDTEKCMQCRVQIKRGYFGTQPRASVGTR